MRHIAKISLFVLLCWAIYRQLFSKGSLWDLWLYDWGQLHNTYFWVAFALIGLNWSLEALKWQYLLRFITSPNFGESLRGVLGGVALALFTPNRIGEYGGRIWWLPQSVRWQGIIALFSGNMLQLSVNIIGGAIGFSVYCYIYRPFVIWQWAIVMALLLVILTLLLLYLLVSKQFRHYCVNHSLFIGLKNRVHHFIEADAAHRADKGALRSPLYQLKYYLFHYTAIGLSRFEEALNTVLQHYSATYLRPIWLLSALRYLVYAGQYVLLLKALGINFSLWGLLLAVLSAYFLQTILPTIAVLELGIKGSIALFVFSPISLHSSAILAATLLLWCFNLALPALIGAIFMAFNRATALYSDKKNEQ